jgi:hypothetical protein
VPASAAARQARKATIIQPNLNADQKVNSY